MLSEHPAVGPEVGRLPVAGGKSLEDREGPHDRELGMGL